MQRAPDSPGDPDMPLTYRLRHSRMKSSHWLCAVACVFGTAVATAQSIQVQPVQSQRPQPAGAISGTQPAVIVQLPPNSPNGGVRPAPRPPEVAPVSPGQDTYSSTGAVPASSGSTTHSSSGRVQSTHDCVRGGVVRKCN
jgi:hypothetical protein